MADPAQAGFPLTAWQPGRMTAWPVACWSSRAC